MTPEQEWRRLILTEIRDVKHEVQGLAKEIHNVSNQINSLKVKVAGISATVAILVTILGSLLSK